MDSINYGSEVNSRNFGWHFARDFVENSAVQPPHVIELVRIADAFRGAPSCMPPRREDAVPEEEAAASHDPMRISSVATSRRRVPSGGSSDLLCNLQLASSYYFFCFLFTEVPALLLPLAIKLGSFRNFAGTDVT